MYSFVRLLILYININIAIYVRVQCTLISQYSNHIVNFISLIYIILNITFYHLNTCEAEVAVEREDSRKDKEMREAERRGDDETRREARGARRERARKERGSRDRASRERERDSSRECDMARACVLIQGSTRG